MTIPGQRVSPEGSTPIGVEGFSTAELSYIWQRMDASQREFITLYYHRARKLHQQATEAWNRRAARLEYLKAYCEANKYNDFQTRQKIIADWGYGDATDDWLRFNREIQRCQAAIVTELKMSMLMPAEARRAK